MSRVSKNLITQKNKTVVLLRVKNDAMQAIQLKRHAQKLYEEKADLQWLRRHMIVEKTLTKNISGRLRSQPEVGINLQ